MSYAKSIGTKLLLGMLLGLVFCFIMDGSFLKFDRGHMWLGIPWQSSDTLMKINNSEMEQNILYSTARLYFYNWKPHRGDDKFEVVESIAHATVKDGCYLVTHNHFSIPFSTTSDIASFYTYVVITDWQGNIVHKAPIADFSIEYVDDGILVLTLAEKQNRWLERLGFQSAPFSIVDEFKLRESMPIVQVDWDGHCTHIDRTTVESILGNGHKRILIMNDSLHVGASGGGTFYDGVHIANNWAVSLGIEAQGNLIQKRGTAVLNDCEFLGMCAQ